MSAPADALRDLAGLLRADGSVVSPHVAEPAADRPALGELAAAGARTAGAPGEYALVVEAVREGYLLHYGDGRVVRGADPDLALLAGDYLYALGLERLAELGDLEAVRELSDLISLSAQVHDGVDGRGRGRPRGRSPVALERARDRRRAHGRARAGEGQAARRRRRGACRALGRGEHRGRRGRP